MTCDPYWADVQLLVTFDGANDSTTFTDLSQNDLTLSAVNFAAVGTANPKFGTGSYVPTGYSGPSYVSCPSGLNGPLDLGSQANWTIEGWFRTTSGYDEGFLQSGTHFSAGLEENGFVYASLQATGGALNVTSVNQYGTGTWHAFAYVFDGTYLYQYIDGVLDGKSAAISGTLDPWTDDFYLGQSNVGPLNLQTSIDEVRVTTIARYSGNYTPATAAFPTVACVYTVPNVIGDTLSVAEAAIIAAELTVGTISYSTSFTVPSGDVISSSPAAGTTVTINYPVDLVVSIGPPNEVPNIVGDTLAQATAAIMAASLVVGSVSYVPNASQPGQVFYQSPAAGTIVSAGSPVNFEIALPSVTGGVTPNCIFDEVIYGAYFGGQLNLVEFTYMPGRTPFEEGATNLIINRYKQEPTDTRQRGVDFTQFVVPGELLQTVTVSAIYAQGVLQADTDPVVTPLVVTDVVIDPVTQLIFAYIVSGGQNGIEYTVQFTTTTNIQTQTLEEIFSINILIEDSFP